MTFTIDSFKADIRGVLGDTDSVAANRRHSDEKIHLATVDALRRMFAVRPDTRYVDGVLNSYDFPATDAQLSPFAVDFDERFRMGIVYYAAARCFETDVVDAVNRELAAGYFKRADEVFAS